MISFFDRAENCVEKKENTGYQSWYRVGHQSVSKSTLAIEITHKQQFLS